MRMMWLICTNNASVSQHDYARQCLGSLHTSDDVWLAGSWPLEIDESWPLTVGILAGPSSHRLDSSGDRAVSMETNEANLYE
jgi:hypothetical protein